MKAASQHTLSLVLLLALVVSCRPAGRREGTAEIAVTNSYLACVVRDLCPQGVEVLCLAPPGMCPGHFDIAPTQVRQLRHCRLLLLFDFQGQTEQKLASLQKRGLKTQLVSAPAGLCIPDAYLATCEQVCRMLSEVYPQRAAEFRGRLPVVKDRIVALSAELRASVTGLGLTGAKVLASSHQAGFAAWLGLEPVDTFIGSDLETIASIDRCLKKAAGQEIRFIIANRQEGTALAEALADRLHAKAVVFSNFPEAAGDAAGFDQLLRDNVRLLREAVGR